MFFGVFLEEVIDQPWNIVFPLSQRRRLKRDNTQELEQPLMKSALGCFRL